MVIIPLLIEGKVYNIPNIGEIVLYPIAKVSQALTDAGFPRDTQTIRKWELGMVIPKAPFKSGGKRLYSMEHIDMIVKAVSECDLKQGVSIEKTDFKERIAKYWIEATKNLTKGGSK